MNPKRKPPDAEAKQLIEKMRSEIDARLSQYYCRPIKSACGKYETIGDSRTCRTGPRYRDIATGHLVDCVAWS